MGGLGGSLATVITAFIHKPREANISHTINFISGIYFNNRPTENTLRCNRYPDSWNHAVIIPILKLGKDPSDTSNYRPIAFTTCHGKILEKMVNARLMYLQEAENCLWQFQSGFRKNRSTIDNLVALESQIQDAFVQNKNIVSIFFDIEKAYYGTWRYGI